MMMMPINVEDDDANDDDDDDDTIWKPLVRE